MRIVEINSVNFGSTGKIMLSIAEVARKNGFEAITFCQKARTTVVKKNKGHYFIGTILERTVSAKLCAKLSIHGKFNFLATKALLHKIKKFKPDIIHMHNLHNDYINLPMLFNFIKKYDIPVVWTLHDCWSFTGHCPYFDIANCDKWKNGCYDCPSFWDYPYSKCDDSKKMYGLKKKWFTGVNNMTLVTPSKWLADLTRESYLKDYPVQVIYNGINLDIFKPTKSDFRKKYGLEDKVIILGVSFSWGYRKGLDVFMDLAEKLDDKYKIVLVGIDKVESDKILCISRTANQKELAQIYSAADLLLNPTREDNFPTVNIEALACGTPVFTFDTGGSPEAIDDGCGVIVDKENIIENIENCQLVRENCVNRGKKFSEKEKFMEYVDLYKRVLKDKNYD